MSIDLLTSVVNVKTMIGLAGNAQDALLALLVQEVSSEESSP